MGHIGVKGLKSAVNGLPFDDTGSETHSSCSVCAEANIKRSPFPVTASNRATSLLERVHCDVCGPLPPCFGSYQYFILFICCYSRFVFVYFMKTRDEAPQHFIDFCAFAQKFSDHKVKILRVDNAPELVKGKLETFCKSEGITYEKTVPHSPSQHGVAERYNQTLNSMARAMLLDAHLPTWFWPFAIQTAVHIKNRVPHSNLPPHVTPFELWYHRKPDLSYLRLFGSHCTSRILPTPLSKFEPRGEPARFLGYARDAKGYTIWVPSPNGRGGTLKIRRDLLFHGFPSSPNSSDDTPLWDEIPLGESSTVNHAPVLADDSNTTPSGSKHLASNCASYPSYAPLIEDSLNNNHVASDGAPVAVESDDVNSSENSCVPPLRSDLNPMWVSFMCVFIRTYSYLLLFPLCSIS
jgi:hypothetical protein